MGNSRPPSLVTHLGKALSAPARLVRLGLLKALWRSLSAMPAAALAGVAVMFLIWSCERQARQREAVEARQEAKQAAQEISRLQKQASSAVRDARENAAAAHELEAQQQQLAREAAGLRQSLESLRQQELARANEVATLPTSEVVSRVASRLGEQGTGNREQGTEQQEQVTGNREQGIEQQEQGSRMRALNPLTRLGEQGTGNREQGTEQQEQGSRMRALDPLTRLALAGESASASHPLPQGGEGKNGPGGEGKSGPGGEGQGSPGALVLSEAGARKVEAAFLELDSCRQQAQVLGQQVSNCEQREQLASSIQEQQSGTVVKLKAALADKDQALERSEQERRAELEAARGHSRAHLLRTLAIFAGGILAGVVLR
jgi:hypothetical protein